MQASEVAVAPVTVPDEASEDVSLKTKGTTASGTLESSVVSDPTADPTSSAEATVSASPRVSSPSVENARRKYAKLSRIIGEQEVKNLVVDPSAGADGTPASPDLLAAGTSQKKLSKLNRFFGEESVDFSFYRRNSASFVRPIENEADLAEAAKYGDWLTVKIVFPSTYPVSYKVMRIQMSITVGEAIQFIAASLNFPACSTSGIGLFPPKPKEAPNIAPLEDDITIVAYAQAIRKLEHLEYKYKDSLPSLFAEPEEPSSGWTRELSSELWSDPDLEGELVKQGHRVPNWKLRWFILQHNKIFYFKERPVKWLTSMPRGAVYLCGCSVSMATVRPYCMQILEKDTRREYLVQASNGPEFDQWFAAIVAASKKEDNQPSAVRHNLHIEFDDSIGFKLDELISRDDPLRLYRDFQQIGAGGFASVFSAVSNRTNRKVAIKAMRITTRNFKFILPEIVNHKNCRHPNVTEFIDAYFRPKEQQLWVALEFLAGGDLTTELANLSQTGRTLSEHRVAYIAREVLQALQYIHSLNRVHRDIKSDNVLLGDRGEVKLADFGFMIQLSENHQRRRSVVGSPYWMAPELIQGKPYGKEVDIWSFGIMTMEMADGLPPYFDQKPQKAKQLIMQHGAPPLKNAVMCSKQLKNFIARCLQRDPAQRATADELLAHPFITANLGVPKGSPSSPSSSPKLEPKSDSSMLDTRLFLTQIEEYTHKEQQRALRRESIRASAAQSRGLAPVATPRGPAPSTPRFSSAAISAPAAATPVPNGESESGAAAASATSSSSSETAGPHGDSRADGSGTDTTDVAAAGETACVALFPAETSAGGTARASESASEDESSSSVIVHGGAAAAADRRSDAASARSSDSSRSGADVTTAEADLPRVPDASALQRSTSSDVPVDTGDVDPTAPGWSSTSADATQPPRRTTVTFSESPGAHRVRSSTMPEPASRMSTSGALRSAAETSPDSQKLFVPARPLGPQSPLLQQDYRRFSQMPVDGSVSLPTLPDLRPDVDRRRSESSSAALPVGRPSSSSSINAAFVASPIGAPPPAAAAFDGLVPFSHASAQSDAPVATVPAGDATTSSNAAPAAQPAESLQDSLSRLPFDPSTAAAQSDASAGALLTPARQASGAAESFASATDAADARSRAASDAYFTLHDANVPGPLSVSDQTVFAIMPVPSSTAAAVGPIATLWHSTSVENVPAPPAAAGPLPDEPDADSASDATRLSAQIDLSGDTAMASPPVAALGGEASASGELLSEGPSHPVEPDAPLDAARVTTIGAAPVEPAAGVSSPAVAYTPAPFPPVVAGLRAMLASSLDGLASVLGGGTADAHHPHRLHPPLEMSSDSVASVASVVSESERVLEDSDSAELETQLQTLLSMLDDDALVMSSSSDSLQLSADGIRLSSDGLHLLSESSDALPPSAEPSFAPLPQSDAVSPTFSSPLGAPFASTPTFETPAASDSVLSPNLPTTVADEQEASAAETSAAAADASARVASERQSGSSSDVVSPSSTNEATLIHHAASEQHTPPAPAAPAAEAPAAFDDDVARAPECASVERSASSSDADNNGVGNAGASSSVPDEDDGRGSLDAVPTARTPSPHGTREGDVGNDALSKDSD